MHEITEYVLLVMVIFIALSISIRPREVTVDD